MKIIEIIKCIVRRDHNYSKEIIVDDNTTRNYCKCGKWLEFDWSYMGGLQKIYKQSFQIRKKK